MLILLTAAIPGVLALVVASAGHLRDRQRFRAVLVTHDLVPFPLTATVARIVPLFEMCAAVATVTALVASSFPSASCASLLVLPQSLLLTAFTFYLAILLVLRGDVPCGCFGSEKPLRTAIARTGVLSALSWVASMSCMFRT